MILPPKTLVPAAAESPSWVAFPMVDTVTFLPSVAVSLSLVPESRLAVTPVRWVRALIALRKAESASFASTWNPVMISPLITTWLVESRVTAETSDGPTYSVGSTVAVTPVVELTSLMAAALAMAEAAPNEKESGSSAPMVALTGMPFTVSSLADRASPAAWTGMG